MIVNFDWEYSKYTTYSDTSRTSVKDGCKKDEFWATKTNPDYFPLNPGWLIGILISWFMK